MASPQQSQQARQVAEYIQTLRTAAETAQQQAAASAQEVAALRTQFEPLAPLVQHLRPAPAPEPIDPWTEFQQGVEQKVTGAIDPMRSEVQQLQSAFAQTQRSAIMQTVAPVVANAGLSPASQRQVLAHVQSELAALPPVAPQCQLSLASITPEHILRFVQDVSIPKVREFEDEVFKHRTAPKAQPPIIPPGGQFGQAAAIDPATISGKKGVRGLYRQLRSAGFGIA